MEYFYLYAGFTQIVPRIRFLNGFASIHQDTDFAGFQQLEKSLRIVYRVGLILIHSSGGDVKEHFAWFHSIVDLICIG